jgi:hypothetical protein
MREPNDWRFTDQERYLKGVPLLWRSYRPASEGNDHDHYEFCWTKFMAGGVHDTLSEGYSTLDGYRWVCKACFDDFVDLFGWQVDRKA